MNKIAELAKEMNVTENDLIGFASVLKLWMDKGYTMEEAIAKNRQQMVRLVNNCSKFDRETIAAITTNAMY